MSESRMTTAEALAVMDSAFGQLGWKEMREARAAVAALVADSARLREAAQQYLDDYESDSGMLSAKYYAEQFRAALAGAGHE